MADDEFSLLMLFHAATLLFSQRMLLQRGEVCRDAVGSGAGVVGAAIRQPRATAQPWRRLAGLRSVIRGAAQRAAHIAMHALRAIAADMTSFWRTRSVTLPALCARLRYCPIRATAYPPPFRCSASPHAAISRSVTTARRYAAVFQCAACCREAESVMLCAAFTPFFDWPMSFAA
jgi:hypothetical protein